MSYLIPEGILWSFLLTYRYLFWEATWSRRTERISFSRPRASTCTQIMEAMEIQENQQINQDFFKWMKNIWTFHFEQQFMTGMTGYYDYYDTDYWVWSHHVECVASHRPSRPDPSWPVFKHSSIGPSSGPQPTTKTTRGLQYNDLQKWRTKHDRYWNRHCQCEQNLKLSSSVSQSLNKRIRNKGLGYERVCLCVYTLHCNLKCNHMMLSFLLKNSKYFFFFFFFYYFLNHETDFAFMSCSHLCNRGNFAEVIGSCQSPNPSSKDCNCSHELFVKNKTTNSNLTELKIFCFTSAARKQALLNDKATMYHMMMLPICM